MSYQSGNQLKPDKPGGLGKDLNNTKYNKFIVFVLVGLLFFLLGVFILNFFGRENIGDKPIYLMMSVLVAIAILVIGIIFIFLASRGKIQRKEPDYRVFFILGITWLPLGFAIENPTFFVLGIVFMIIGLANKDKWKDQPKFKDLPPAQKNFKVAILIILSILVLLGLLAFYFAAK